MTERIVYAATINTPGYLPESDEPFYSHDLAECWAYLRDERERAEDEAGPEGEDYSDTLSDLKRHTRYAAHGVGTTGTVYGTTPGYTGSHDLGKAYSVEPTSDVRWDEESDTWVSTLMTDDGPCGCATEGCPICTYV